MRGFRRERPSLPRYEETFDARVVLDWIETNWPSNESLSLADLRTKAIVLLRITSLKRSRDIAKMVKASIEEAQDGSCSFRMLDEKRPDGVGEQSRRYPIFKNNLRPAICAWQALQEYLARTQGLAGANLDTVFRWLDRDKPLGKDAIAKLSDGVLRDAGIPGHFRAHSFRMAGASLMINQGVPVQDVLRIGGWTSMEVFQRFYNRSRIAADTAERMAGELGHDE